MKLCVSKEWLREKIDSDHNVCVEAGANIRNSNDVITAMYKAQFKSNGGINNGTLE